MSVFVGFVRSRLFLGVYNSKKNEVKMVQMTDVISLVQKVNGFKPTVTEGETTVFVLNGSNV